MDYLELKYRKGPYFYMLLVIRKFSLPIVIFGIISIFQIGFVQAQNSHDFSKWQIVNETFTKAISQQNNFNSAQSSVPKLNPIDELYQSRFVIKDAPIKLQKKDPILLPRLRKKSHEITDDKKQTIVKNISTVKKADNGALKKGIWRLEIGNEDRGIFVDLWEPIFDPIFGGSPTDGGMSWGLHLSYTPHSKNPIWFQKLRAYIPWIDPNAPANVSYSFEQSANMHSHLARKARNHSEHLWTSDQRPDAGFLAANARVGLKKNYTPRWDRIDTIDFRGGIVGPYSGAQPFHQFVHDLTGGSTDKWHQINSEPFVNLNYEHGHRFFLWKPNGRETIEIHPHTGFALGNAFTHAKVGLNARIGRLLENDMGAPRFSQMLTGTNFPKINDHLFSWNFFTGFEGKAHAHNVTLDENLISGGGQSVNSHMYTYDVHAGFEFGYGDYRLTFMNVYRSREFKGQQYSSEFVRVALAAEF